VNLVAQKLKRCAEESIAWAPRRELQFDTAKTEAVHFTRRRGHRKRLHSKLTAKARVGGGFGQFILNKEATRWLGS